MNTNQKVASFRINADKWADFIEYARSNNRTATSLILDYIDSCIQSGHDRISTNIIHHDKSDSLNTNINSLKKVQNSLVEQGKKHDLNINKLFSSVEELTEDDETIRYVMQQLENNFKNLFDYHHRHHEIIDDVMAKNTKNIEKLKSQNQAIWDVVAVLKLQQMTVKQIKELLDKTKIQYGDRDSKDSLVKLALKELKQD